MAAATAHPASLAPAALRRHYPRQEPSALDAHARICAGGAGNGGPYRDRDELSRLRGDVKQLRKANEILKAA